MRIELGDLDDPEIQRLLATHLRQCHAETEPGSAHALDVSGLKQPDISFFAGHDDGALVAVGALKRLEAGHGEVKSMHTARARRRGGLGGEMLAHIVVEARRAGLRRLSLETGAWDFFIPARALYRAHGFRDCPPFIGYRPDRNSAFFTLRLADEAPRDVIEVRDAEDHDIAALTAIYNDVVARSTAIYSETPASVEERLHWFHARRDAGFPLLVADRDGDVVGFASYGPFRSAPGYRATVEHSVHVSAEVRSGGAGAAMMTALLDRARAAKVHAMVGAVDAANEGSLRFHDRLGFERGSPLREVGQKFGRWLDLVFVTKRF